MSLMDAMLPVSSNEKVELPILWFLDQFCKMRVGVQLQHTSEVKSALNSDDQNRTGLWTDWPDHRP